MADMLLLVLHRKVMVTDDTTYRKFRSWVLGIHHVSKKQLLATPGNPCEESRFWIISQHLENIFHTVARQMLMCSRKCRTRVQSRIME